MGPAKEPICDMQRNWCWKILVGTSGVFVVAFMTLVGYVIANDRKAEASALTVRTMIEAHKLESQRELSSSMELIRRDMNGSFSEVVQRLARIEAKIQ